jgi:enoyl-CoA hydratase/carnithine racemase
MIRSEVDRHILTVTLDRPDKLNAFDRQACFDMVDVVRRADEDDEVRAVIVTGNGKAFCAGKDLAAGGRAFDHGAAAAADVNAPDPRTGVVRDGGGLVALSIFQCRKPIIGAINGDAVGIGATMILPMDLRLAAEDARFGYVFARRGIPTDGAASWFLPRAVGMQTALDWTYSGRLVSAREALDCGLLLSVHPREAVLEAARERAREIVTRSSPLAVALIRQMFWRNAQVADPMLAHEIESRGVAALGAMADANEGVRSFLEKRPPQFGSRPSRDMPAFYPWWRPTEFGDR